MRAKVGDVCKLVNGKAFKPSDWSEVGVPIIRIQNLNDVGKPFNYWAGPLNRQVKVADGDVLLAWSGTPGTSFGVHIWRRGPGILNQHIFRVDLDKFVVTPEWFRYAVNGQLNRLIAQAHGGVGLQHVTRSMVDNLEIPLPPLPEQRRISAILDKADALRRKRKRAIELLGSLTQSIFLKMFGDPKSNPKGWDSPRLGDLCDVGSSKRVFVEEFVDRGVPFYRGTEVGKLGVGQDIEPNLFIASHHYDDLVSHSGKPELGDLLLPSICHDGRIWKVDNTEPFYFKDGRVLWIKSHQAEIDSEYLRRYLQFRFLSDYASIASGTTFAELKIVNLKNLTVLFPPIELQMEFSSSISAVDAMRRANRQSQATVDSFFSSLQHRAFSGQL